jgi:sterol 3beta-glucosyltransferase
MSSKCNGCVTMVIPHIIDQFVWDKIIYRMGAGPKGVKIGKITTENLESKIIELLSNSAFKKKAEQIARHMEQENFREELCQAISE